MDTSDYTSQSNPSLNFTNNGKLQYNYVHGTDKVPNLYYYYNPDSEHPERNSRFECRNNSVIGNDPWAGYIEDGGMIMRDEDYVLKDIPELDVFPSTDTTKNIHVSQTGTYEFVQDDPNYYDPEKKIFRAYNFSTENQTTVTFNPGEYHFKSWNRCETQLTIVIPEFGDNDYELEDSKPLKLMEKVNEDDLLLNSINYDCFILWRSGFENVKTDKIQYP